MREIDSDAREVLTVILSKMKVLIFFSGVMRLLNEDKLELGMKRSTSTSTGGRDGDEINNIP